MSAANKQYRVVNIEILTSPCRKCSEAICNRSSCEKLIAFQSRCDQELPSYGVCNCEGDELPSPVKSNFTNDILEGEAPAPTVDSTEEYEATFDKSEPTPKKERKRKPVVLETKPQPETKPEPAAAEPLIPVDMTLEQIFPPARMAQLAPQKFTQLSLF